MKRLLCSIALLGCLALTSHGQALEGFANEHGSNADDIRYVLIEEQLVRSLEASHEPIVVQSLHNAIVLSVMSRDRLDIHRLGNAIIKTHKKNRSPEVRETALAALLVIGGPRAVAYARQSSSDGAETSRTVAMNVLESYFGNRYVEAVQLSNQ